MTGTRQDIARIGRVFAAALVLALAGAAPAWAAGGGKDAADSGSGFIGQMQVTATVMRAMRPMGMMQVDAGLLVPDATLRARVLAMGPILRAAWRGAAQDYVTRQYRPGEVPDVQAIATGLQAATDRALGRTGAQVVMISVIAR
jgi:hypothetical protein